MYQIAFLLAFAGAPAFAQMQHTSQQAGMIHSGFAQGDRIHATLPESAVQMATEGGQSAFAAIQEIVTLLMADPKTDWTKVDIAALQAHLIDMNNLTLRAAAQMESLENGASFAVTSADPKVIASIQRMIPAHVATMDGSGGWAMPAEIVEASTGMQVTGDAEAGQMIRALGFIGVMATGMHHQMHHLAIASGQAVHRQ